MVGNKVFKNAAGALLLVGVICAQEKDVLTIEKKLDVLIQGEAPRHAATFEFISSEVGIEGQTVKGAPFSAEAVNENTQVLSDGNRISRKTSTGLHRDGEGRTRREVSLSSIGPWAAADDAPTKLVMIYDPVAGVSYTLDEKTKTARKMTGRGMAFAYVNAAPAPAPDVAPAAGVAAVPGVALDLGMPARVHAMRTPVANDPNAKTESLGKRNIEGVVAEGTRRTLTIQAGEIGNERPIEIVTERWYSPELQTVVMTRHNNPMTGENVYKLTNIRRGEPPKSLFEVPPDYTIKVEEPPLIRMRRPAEK